MGAQFIDGKGLLVLPVWNAASISSSQSRLEPPHVEIAPEAHAAGNVAGPGERDRAHYMHCTVYAMYLPGVGRALPVFPVG